MTELIKELQDVLFELDLQIAEYKKEFAEPFRMRDRHGRFLMADALTAKAYALSALATLVKE